MVNVTPEELELIQILLQNDQSHVFDAWSAAGNDEEAKHAFLKQVDNLNKICQGGLAGYLSRAKQLLEEAKKGCNAFEGWTPHVPAGVKLVPFSKEYKSYECSGSTDIGLCGFVLVAGGLGERLGYSGIKVSLPVETVTNTTYLQHYCLQIVEMQRRSSHPNIIPLAIMVSGDTEKLTRELLEANGYYGLDRRHVTLLVQEKVPAMVTDSLLKMKTPYELETKPHGHGDVHALMYSSGLAQKWLADGVKWAVFFQDTNALSFLTLPAMIGVSKELGLDMNSMAIDRYAKQAIGAITKLVDAAGRELTINVEYNQLQPLLASVHQEDINDPITHFSAYPGNINQLLFRMEMYVATLQHSQGFIPEFVNPKYQDSRRLMFKSPTRLECMMQDFPKLLPPLTKVGFTSAPAWLCYSPVKNNPVDAAASIRSGVPAASPYTAECDQYAVFARLLRMMGAHVVQPATTTKVLGIYGTPSPRIVFHPSFVLFPCDLEKRFPCPSDVNIDEHSTLVVEGEVVVESLDLHGSLWLRAVPGSKITVSTRGTRIENANHEMVLLEDLDPTTIYKIGLKDPVTEAAAHAAQQQSTTPMSWVPALPFHYVREADEIRGYLLIAKGSANVSTATMMTSATAAPTVGDMRLTEEVKDEAGDFAAVGVLKEFVYNGMQLIDKDAYHASTPLLGEQNACVTCTEAFKGWFR